MSKDVFGEPTARDPTSEWEKDVEEAAREHAEMFDFAKERVMNRQLGSKKVPLKDRMAEYKMARENPEWLSQVFVDAGATVEEMVNEAWDMEHKLRNG